MNNHNGNRKVQREIIGLLPAGGQATRISPLPCSKELYPIGFRAVDGGRSLRPKVVCHYLLEKMQLAGVSNAYIVLRKGKWDIPAYLGDGSMLDINLAYLMMRLPFGAPYTLDQAYPFVQESLVAFGFPDIIFQPKNAFVQLLERQAATNADVVLGLFPAPNPQKMDMVELDQDGRVRQIVIKPQQTDLHYTWIIAVWSPAFSHFMHDYLTDQEKKPANNGHDPANPAKRRELYVGHVFQAAIDQNLRVEAVLFPHGTCLDIGTPNDLVKGVNEFDEIV